ncbi:MAG TPA: hypothetical protein IAD51_03350 [Candidatus Limadaptatus stercorigallinarum]|uniref:Uncharacterized protein n=1 Tax=Candidatus Limadaptatus stercorigallinarum TaxID=2840845 RepID=A0A9D1L2S8_9FIRM|nr:hypothetical protein [Candidatus Limadaptatus stercorigallinarum]
MKHKSGANYAKIAVIAVALAVAATCTVSGTLAAFSATYTWNSDSASAGDIGFRDTVYSFGLFNNSFIVPGDSGSATLTGADFGGHAVEWTFESHNENAMPVVFYSLDEEGNPDFSSFYSEYDFTDLAGFYALCEDGTAVPVSEVSVDPAAIAQGLGIGKTVCWAWFDTFYTDQTCETEASGSEVDAYEEYCRNICTQAYAFDAGIGDILGNVSAHAFVTGVAEDALTVCSFDLGSEKQVVDGLLTMGGVTVYVERYGMFTSPSASVDLTGDSAVWVLFPAVMSDDADAALSEAGIRYEKGGLYSLGADVTAAIEAVPDAGGNRILYKIFPSEAGERAQISVTISATVTV